MISLGELFNYNKTIVPKHFANFRTNKYAIIGLLVWIGLLIALSFVISFSFSKTELTKALVVIGYVLILIMDVIILIDLIENRKVPEKIINDSKYKDAAKNWL